MNPLIEPSAEYTSRDPSVRPRFAGSVSGSGSGAETVRHFLSLC